MRVGGVDGSIGGGELVPRSHVAGDPVPGAKDQEQGNNSEGGQDRPQALRRSAGRRRRRSHLLLRGVVRRRFRRRWHLWRRRWWRRRWWWRRRVVGRQVHVRRVFSVKGQAVRRTVASNLVG